MNNVCYLIGFFACYQPESLPYLCYTCYMLWMFVYRRGAVIQPNFYVRSTGAKTPDTAQSCGSLLRTPRRDRPRTGCST